MAIEWGAWEGSGNAMRVGIEVNWSGPVQHGWDSVKATVSYYTQNNYAWDDDQSLNLGGAIDGSIGFRNGQGDGVVTKRGERSRTYNYGNNEYGSSPGKWTFSATLQGAYNGITPSKSVTVNIPSRPIGEPNNPTNVSVSRISDSSQRISWNNNSTNARPWNTIDVDRDIGANGNWLNVSRPGGGASYTTDSNTNGNQRYRYRVKAINGQGSSAWIETGIIYTSPYIPSNVTRTPGSGSTQIVSWENRPGHNEYFTEIQRGVTPAGSSTTTWTLIETASSGTTSYPDTGAQVSEATKYRVRHKITAGVQPNLYSDWSDPTSETAGQTTPPNAPSNLTPDGLIVDPTLLQRLSWKFNPGMTGDTQTKYEVQHRIAGSGVWKTVTQTSSNTYYNLPANTYGEEKIVEWQVRTWGADPTASAYSAPVSFQTAVAPIPEDPIKLPVLMDLFTGRLEANANAYEARDYALRYQSNVTGGGIRSVSTSYQVSWSQRFVAIALGRSTNTFPFGHHDITMPYGWTPTTKQIVVTAGVSRATLTVSTSDVKVRPGEFIVVNGMGAPYDGEWIVRSISSNQISFDLPVGTAAQASTAVAAGSVYPRIRGHGGASSRWSTSQGITLDPWDALYYELPFGWGGGSVIRKNGLVNVTSKEITSNIATLGIASGHWFVVGDRIFVEGVGAPFDSVVTSLDDGSFGVTAVTPTSVSFALTNANITQAAVTSPTARARPTGKDTFMGNFRVVNYTSDFVIPPNWVMLAIRNNDTSSVEWAWGDAVDPGYDSDSPVFKQAIFTSTAEANFNTGNKPAIRVGNISGNHLRIDGDEVVSMDSGNSRGPFVISCSRTTFGLSTTGGATMKIEGQAGVSGGGPWIGRGDDGVGIAMDSTRTRSSARNFNDHVPHVASSHPTSSDAKLKDDIRPAEGTAEVFASLEAKSFRWKNSGKESYGFVAQEVAEVLPNAVTEDIGALAVDPYPLLAVLWSNVKALASRVESQESRIARLESILEERMEEE